jgi:hypothetical protein
MWIALVVPLLLIGFGGAGLLIPALRMPWGVAAVLIAAAFLLPAFMVAAAIWSRTGYVEIDDSRLIIRGVPNSRSFHLRSLRLPESRALDLRDDPSLRPAASGGVNLPGLLAGSGSLAGGERIAWLLTDLRRVAYVPAREGNSLPVSVESPEDFVEALHSAWASAESREQK